MQQEQQVLKSTKSIQQREKNHSHQKNTEDVQEEEDIDEDKSSGDEEEEERETEQEESERFLNKEKESWALFRAKIDNQIVNKNCFKTDFQIVR